ncbi:MotA/TolQ/ExbB proton channel family protein [Porphyromonas sp. COT-239 OH1446]|uniref:MotA/TolQ/ExbB proton channel family protein n=1 Tax=Porphyromonas sp. COT-239 OH1446 TaxID=1515613 RepID=UPI00052E36CB|nr:MotA/TolQ/ExbB proton channel family protein [Porphyromonas sp. COT-239 OH1446]KGN67708.1 flagellar motor protein MotA [Porphyromonas sp. COT-239 OH1446]
MKKLFATIACVALLSVGFSTAAVAQDQTAATPEQVVTDAEAAVEEATATEAPVEASAEETVVAENASFHQALKSKFIDGGADFMSFVVITLILGLAISLERIIYLNLANVNPDQMLHDIEEALVKRNDLEGAKKIARETRGPIASIAYQALLRADQDIDIVEKSVVSYGGVQGGLLEKNLSWITLFIAMAPSLGFLGTVVGMVLAFDKIEQVGDISPTVVAGGMKVALITTIGGLVVALILQVFYNYILSLVEGILNRMEDASITLLDLVVKYNVKNNK